jgi:hypothetical protein
VVGTAGATTGDFGAAAGGGLTASGTKGLGINGSMVITLTLFFVGLGKWFIGSFGNKCTEAKKKPKKRKTKEKEMTAALVSSRLYAFRKA